jgi:hypothetical protein
MEKHTQRYILILLRDYLADIFWYVLNKLAPTWIFVSPVIEKLHFLVVKLKIARVALA